MSHHRRRSKSLERMTQPTLAEELNIDIESVLKPKIKTTENFNFRFIDDKQVNE